MSVDPDFNGEADARGRGEIYCGLGDGSEAPQQESERPETVETPTPTNGESTDVGTNDVATEQPLFGSLSPAEAGRRSAARRAERALAGETDQATARADEVRIVRCTVEVGKVIEKLAKDAKGGNVQAARELRAYLRDLPTESDTEVSSLDRRTRQQVLARVLSEIAASEEGLHVGVA